jgi:glycosyltransferase involved in cell wall biosynthesis
VSDTFLWKSETLIEGNLEFKTENVLEVSFRSGNFPSEEPTMFSLTEAAKPLITARKTVLICAINLYSSKPNGGGATYKRIIDTNSEIDFFSFKTYLDPSNESPNNLIEIPIGLKDTQGSVLENLLRATSGSTFDYLDIPDWLLPSQSIVTSLQDNQVNVGKIICSLHGSNSMVFKTHPFNPKKFLQTNFFKRKEKILYREAHYFYGFSDKYASSLQLKKKFLKISPFEMLQDYNSLATSNIPSKEKRLVPVFVGRKEYTKGFDLFLKLISRNEIFEKAIIYATSAFDYEEYRQMLNFEMSCIDRIEFSQIATQEEILEVVNLSNSLFVFPSRFDSFNLTFFQILMSGGLIVCSENINARQFADELQLKYLDFSMIKSKIDIETLMAEGTKILQHNRNRIIEIQKELKNSKPSSFGNIYV